MKHIGIGLAALLLLAPVAISDTEKPPPATAIGQVVSVDAATMSMVVKMQNPSDPGEVTFVVADDAKIVRNGKPASLGDLAEGDNVTVGFRVEDGKKVAVSVGAHSKA